MLSCVLISYAYEWNVLKPQHFLPFKKEVLQCDNAPIMTSHLRMSFCFSKIFLAPEKYFILIATQTKWLLILLFFSSLSKGEAWLKPSVTEQNCCEGMAAPFQTLPGLGKTPTAVRCRAKYCVSWVWEQHVERCGYTCFCTEKYTVCIHTRVYIYRYIYTLLIYSTHQTSSLCSGRCFANRLSMGRKRKDPLYVVANVKSFQWYTTQRFRFLSQTSLSDNF